jgi:carboxylesterase
VSSNANILPPCEPFSFDGGEDLGVLLQHGFTGCPASMRPFGEWLRDQGVTAVGPRLPGHGTTWEDLATTRWQDWVGETERALDELAKKCRNVVLVGLSMGGAIVLHLAVKHPETVRGVVAINAYVNDSRLLAAPIGALVAKSRNGVGNDIKKPGQDEISYAKIPMKALPSLGQLLRMTEKELPSLKVPLLVFSSNDDHTVKPKNSQIIMAKAGTSQKELVRLTNSYHVATLDYDAPLVFERTLAFARSVSRNGQSSPATS